MSDNKKYYYLKLKDNFFDSEKMVVLEAMKDGYLYSNILLKLYLKSLKFDGKLMFTDKIPYNSEMLASVVRHPVGVLIATLKILKDLDLIEIWKTGEIFLKDIQNFVGHSSTEGDRKRLYRNKMKEDDLDIDTEKEQDFKANGTFVHQSLENRVKSLEFRDKDKKYKKSISKEIPKKNDFFDCEIEYDFFKNNDFVETMKGFIDMRKSIRKPLTKRAFIAILNKLVQSSNNDINIAIKILENSVINSWAGVFELKSNSKEKPEIHYIPNDGKDYKIIDDEPLPF